MVLWYYNYNNTDYLCHHGVKGMKWGVIKKYEPIGRNKKEYTIPNKKSGHRVRLEAKYLSKGYSDDDAEQMAAKRIRGEKFVAVAGGITVAVATAFLTAQIVKVFKMENDIQKNMKHVFDTARNNGVARLSDLPIIKNDHNIKDDLKAINPRYPIVRPAKWGQKDSVWETNCGFCATAFEMRRRGFDVEAVSNGKGMTAFTPLTIFKNPITKKTTPLSAYDDISDECLKWGKGARGMVSVAWKTGGGHAFSFENLNDRGLVLFVDPQVNDLKAATYFAHAKSVRFMRLDNLELKDKMLDAIKIKGVGGSEK